MLWQQDRAAAAALNRSIETAQRLNDSSHGHAREKKINQQAGGLEGDRPAMCCCGSVGSVVSGNRRDAAGGAVDEGERRRHERVSARMGGAS